MKKSQLLDLIKSTKRKIMVKSGFIFINNWGKSMRLRRGPRCTAKINKFGSEADCVNGKHIVMICVQTDLLNIGKKKR